MRSIFLLATIPAVLAAIERVETGGHRCPSRAVGDGGRSLGPMQIQRAYHHDAWGTVRGYERVRDREYARQTVIKYWLRYCPSAYRRGDVRTLARWHNGGPGAHHSAAARRYAEKVARRLYK